MIEAGKCYTCHPSDLYVMIYKINDINEERVNVKAIFFYKNTRNICKWLNPTSAPEDFSLSINVLEYYNEHNTGV